jgi:kynurenine formamidase
MVNLGELPPERFTVACFPRRVAAGSAAPARVMAIM